MSRFFPGGGLALRYLTGIAAGIVACYFLVSRAADLQVVAASIYFVLACAFDTTKAKIPNLLNASLAVAGLALFFYRDGWTGLTTGLAGLALGVALLILPWLMGGMGAGDVKALGALGALIGPSQLLHVFIYMGLIGGVMAILHYASERNLRAKAGQWLSLLRASVLTNDPKLLIPDKTEVSRFPYAAAIAFGYYLFVTAGSLI